MKSSCGRNGGCAGPTGVSPRTVGLLAVFGALLVAGCGGIDSPDLATGQVSGRLVGVKPGAGAYVYALGKPETKVLVADDGSYTVNKVPVGSSSQALVAFDGETRADYIAAEVKPASKTKLDELDANTLRPARSVAASVACSYGISTDGVSYDVEGVALRDEGHGAQAVLFPVPPGVFKVRARAAGMLTVERSVDVSNDTTGSFEVEMEVDDGDSHKGCLSSSCTGDLKCDSDGHCYACTTDTQCGAGFTCHSHQCESAGGSGAPVCTACSGDSECASGPLGSSQPGRCLLNGTCSHGCATNLDCPSGFACQDFGGSVGRACVPPTTCADLFAVFGTFCTADESCAPIVDPKCVGKGMPTAYCSSRCAVNADCPTTALGTFTCDPVLRVCLKP